LLLASVLDRLEVHGVLLAVNERHVRVADRRAVHLVAD
jgi:hypothetical protein